MSSAALPFSEFVDRLVREVIRADAHAQILQQSGWIDFQGFMKGVKGIDLTEGIGQLEYLGLQEVKLTFRVEPIRPGWARLKKCVRYVMGREEAPATMACRIVGAETATASGFTVTVTVGRSAGGRFVARSEPAADGLEGVYVADILA